MYTTSRPVYPNELYHHGIKGQRWGVRNGPPYPLNPQTHASVVRSGNRGRTRPVARGKIGSIDNAIWLNKSNNEWNKVYYDPDTNKLMLGRNFGAKKGFESASSMRRREILKFGQLEGSSRGYGKHRVKEQKRLNNVYKTTKNADAVKKEWNKMQDEQLARNKEYELKYRKKGSRGMIRSIKKEAKMLSKQYGHTVYPVYNYDNYTWRYVHSKSGRAPKLKPGEKIV